MEQVEQLGQLVELVHGISAVVSLQVQELPESWKIFLEVVVGRVLELVAVELGLELEQQGQMLVQFLGLQLRLLWLQPTIAK